MRAHIVENCTQGSNLQGVVRGNSDVVFMATVIRSESEMTTGLTRYLIPISAQTQS